MNGITDVTIKGEKHQLRFGMQAFLIFQDRSTKNSAPVNSIEAGLKSVCDLFFAGMTGNCIRNEMPIKSFAECCDLFDELSMEPDFNDQVSKIWECFGDSIKNISNAAENKTVKKKATKK